LQAVEETGAAMTAGTMPGTRAAMGPRPILDGVRVVDFTRLLPGGYCTWLLATLGADVIKVEQPGRGDYQREYGFEAGPRGSAMFQLVNQGKRSIALDLKDPEARPALDALLASADIVVEGFRPGVASRLGIDFADMLARRPELVCVSISGFGTESPLRDRAAHDINYLAFSGVLHRLVQSGEGIPEIPLADIIGGGLMPALNVLALLLRSRQTGQGGMADMALVDGVPLLPTDFTSANMVGMTVPPKSELELSGHAPHYRVYALKDGHVAVGALEDPFWRRLCERLGLAEHAALPRPQRGAEIGGLLSRKFAAMTRDEVEAMFGTEDACVSLVLPPAEMLSSPHALARQYTASAPADDALPRLGSPFFFDGARQFIDGPAPFPGQDSEAILRELGLAQPDAGRKDTPESPR
jgi:crotonobetainyl-CoA:carnitine CoA-transferase CaiB-like acyl-CoA transferase